MYSKLRNSAVHITIGDNKNEKESELGKGKRVDLSTNYHLELGNLLMTS